MLFRIGAEKKALVVIDFANLSNGDVEVESCGIAKDEIKILIEGALKERTISATPYIIIIDLGQIKIF